MAYYEVRYGKEDGSGMTVCTNKILRLNQHPLNKGKDEDPDNLETEHNTSAIRRAIDHMFFEYGQDVRSVCTVQLEVWRVDEPTTKFPGSKLLLTRKTLELSPKIRG